MVSPLRKRYGASKVWRAIPKKTRDGRTENFRTGNFRSAGRTDGKFSDGRKIFGRPVGPKNFRTDAGWKIVTLRGSARGSYLETLSQLC